MTDETRSSRRWREDYRSRVRGCVVGGAVGDALGAPIEFLSWHRIHAAYGSEGVTDMVSGPYGFAAITDDTQMTLFTIEGLIRASVRAERGICHVPSVVHGAYLRWLDTQRYSGPSASPDGWLAGQRWLYSRRAPGNACLSGLRQDGMGTPANPHNPNSKGCGAVMRSAPFGLVPPATPEIAFDLAAECATQTHGHPSGFLAAGAFAAIIRALLDGDALPDAVVGALRLLGERPGHEETTAALRQAMDLVRNGPPTPLNVEVLGGGWVAEEALAISVYCALSYPDPTEVRRAMLLAVNHSGDSDSTGAICGNLLGAWHGETAVPPAWVSVVEGRETILELADDLVTECTRADRSAGDHGPSPAWARRYPGG